jgi:PKD repeat protein
MGSAVSPPFRVRATTCVWPATPVFNYTPITPTIGQSVYFYGSIGYGSGPITFTWDFGDGSAPALGQNVVHSFTTLITRSMNVNLIVSGLACPITRPVFTSASVTVGNPVSVKYRFFLPLINSPANAAIISPASANKADGLVAPDAINILTGQSDATSSGVVLSWQPPGGTVTRYRVYRGITGVAGPFELLTELPADVTSFTDTSAVCGHVYYVTAINGPAHESAPSTSSFYNTPCIR